MVPTFFGPFAEELVDAVGPEPGISVLDVACGTGALTRALARRVGPGGTVIGLDVSPGMIVVARDHDPDDGAAPTEYVEGVADDLPVERGSFDLVTCQQGLQFFPDRPAALCAMRDVLAPGGLVAIATWREAHGPWLALADALGRHIDPDARVRMLAPFGLADPAELRTLLEAAGLVDVVVEPHTLTTRFRQREAFARRLVLATPLAGAFVTASPEQRERIIAEVSAAVDDCDGDEHDLLLPMTTNVALAAKPADPA